MTETRDAIPSLEVTPSFTKLIDPVVIIIQAHSEDKTTTETEVIIYNKGLEVKLDPYIQVQSIDDPQLYLGLLDEKRIGLSVTDKVIILSKNTQRMTSLRQSTPLERLHTQA